MQRSVPGKTSRGVTEKHQALANWLVVGHKPAHQPGIPKELFKPRIMTQAVFDPANHTFQYRFEASIQIDRLLLIDIKIETQDRALRIWWMR
jgi:hypothetical protein